MLFGTDTTLQVPRAFFSSQANPTGTSLADILSQPQSTTSRTPSAFTGTSFSLKPGESKTISLVYGDRSRGPSNATHPVPTLPASYGTPLTVTVGTPLTTGPHFALALVCVRPRP